MANSLISDWFIQVFSTPKPIEIFESKCNIEQKSVLPSCVRKKPTVTELSITWSHFSEVMKGKF